MDRYRVAVHPARADDPTSWTFDPASFSRFKHGSVREAWAYAQSITDTLFEAYPEIMANETLVISGSCYKHVPLASVTLARLVYRLVNHRRLLNGVGPVTFTQIYRGQLIAGDFSGMSSTERDTFIAGDRISGDPIVLTSAPVIVIDDVRITGSTERLIDDLLQSTGVSIAVYAYLVTIEGADDPTLEARLNTAAVSTPAHIMELAGDRGFELNSRALKVIISATANARAAFIAQADRSLLVKVADGVIANGYAMMEAYRSACAEIIETAYSLAREEVTP